MEALQAERTEARDEVEALKQRVRELEHADADRRHVEEECRQLHERLDLAQRAANAGTWDWDIVSGRIEWSPQTFDLFGLDPTQSGASFASWEGALHPDDIDIARQRIERALQDRTPLDSDYRIVHPTGSVRWINSRGECHYDKGGRPVRMIGICTDITGRKRMEEALRQNEEQLRVLFDHSADVIYTIDRDHVIRTVSPSLERWLGYRPEEIIGRKFTEIAALTPESLRKAVVRVAAILSGQTIPPDTFTFIAREGTRKWAEISSAPVIKDGAVTGIISIIRDITERRHTEEALRESEERYKILVEKSFAGVYVVQDGRFVFLNNNAASFAGYRPADLTGRQSDSIVLPEDRVWVRERAKRMLRGKDTSPYEFRITTKDGRIRWIMETVVSIQFQGRQAILGNSMDITARKTAEKALRESRELEKSILSSVPHALFGVERRRIFFANDAMEDVFGWTPEELVGMSTRLIFRNDREWEAYGAILYRELTWRSVYVFESDIPFVRKDGREIYCRMSVSRIGPELGETRRIVATFEDITERKHVEAALRESRERLQMTLEAVNDGVWDWNVATGRAVFSPSYYTMLGYEPYEFAQTYEAWRDLVHPEDIGRAEREIKDCLAKNEGYAIDIRMRTKAGDWCWILTRGKTIEWDADGNPVRMVGTHSDITERKREEEERENLRGQLLQAQKMESVGRLAGGVAHDFNNMLGVILGHVEMVMEETSPEQTLYADLTEIRKAAQRSTELTGQLLAFARKQTVSPRVLDVTETVAGMLKMLKRLIGEDIELAWLPGSVLWPVLIDPSQFDQILANLCVNARDAITGVGRIAIETANVVIGEGDRTGRTDLQPGEYVLLSVADNGVGMSREVLRNLFEPFFTTKETGKGTGLGLAMVYGIVKQNGGFIDVASQPGRGSTMRIYLPRHLGDTRYVPASGDQGPALPGWETVLVVEDEPAILGLAKRMLEKQGYCVMTAATPGEAIRVASENNGDIHLLMTDVVMPEMNGRELADRLLAVYPDMRILFMSGYADNVIAGNGDLDESDFLPKPFSTKQLSAKVRRVLSRKKSARSGQEAS